MSQAQFSIPIDLAVMEQFEAVCNQVGSDAVAVVKGLVANVVREKRLPFAIEDTWESDEHLFYSEKNLAHLRQAIAEMKEGKFVVHDLIEVKE